jgi:hypothetical protein
MLATLTPARTGPVKDLLDLSFRKTTGKYGFVNSGYLEIPADGVYSFHAPFEFVWPGDSGYDLRFFLMFGEQGRGRWEEWYPGTRALNHGTWSVPLKKGKYAYRLEYVDQRPGADQWVYPEFKSTARVWNGEKPVIEISGPGLERQPIPARMLQIQTR